MWNWGASDVCYIVVFTIFQTLYSANVLRKERHEKQERLRKQKEFLHPELNDILNNERNEIFITTCCCIILGSAVTDEQ